MIPPAAVRLSPAIVRFSTCLSRNRHPSSYTCGHLIKVNVKPSRFVRGVCDFVNQRNRSQGGQGSEGGC